MATILEDSNTQKYSMQGARARVMEDIVAIPGSYLSGAVISKRTGVAPLGAAVSYTIDQSVNEYQDNHHRELTREEVTKADIEYTDKVSKEGFNDILD